VELAGLGVFSQEFVSMFLSSEYQDAALVIVILSVYYASMFIGKITGAQLIYAKKTHITTLLMFLGIAINVGLNIPFIINWGIFGAAWATTISGVIMTIIGYLVAQKYVEIYWNMKMFFFVYLVFLLATLFSLMESIGVIGVNNYQILAIKMGFIIVYLLILLIDGLSRRMLVKSYRKILKLDGSDH
jgi:O-antigen/teichoic acid export membrane protein